MASVPRSHSGLAHATRASTLTNLGPAGQIAATATIQGGVQALLGGSFKDGALAGLASGLANAASGSLDAKIAEAALNGSMTTAEVFAAKTFSKVLGSAIRAAGSPGDPGQAFASAFLTEVVGRPSAAPAPSPYSLAGAGAVLGNGSSTVRLGTGDDGSALATPPPGWDDAPWVETGEPHADGPARLPVDHEPAANETAALVKAPPQEPHSQPRPPTGTAEGSHSGNSIYDARFVEVPGVPGRHPVGGFENLRRAPELQFLSQDFVPRLLDGRTGLGVPYVDQVGQVYYKTFDADGKSVGLVSAPVLASSLPLAARLAPAARVVVGWELASGQPLLQAAAGATLVGVGVYAAWNFDALSPDERRNAEAPLINVPPAEPTLAAPPQPLPDWADRPEVGTPGYEAQAPAGPTTTTTPITGQDWRDLLIEQSNSENNRDLAQERFRNNPSLQDPSKLAGTKIPGVGTWGYPGTPRGNDGAEYGEQINGVPAGLELNVGGVPNAQGVITGGAWIDGVEIRNGQTILIERKDWARYPPLGANFWHTETVKQAIRQIDAAQQIGAKVEWHVSTQAAADAVSALFNARAKLEDVRLTQIDIRVVPKK